MPLNIVLARTGQAWEDALLAEVAGSAGISAVAQCHTMVELLVAVEVESPQITVVPVDFPRLAEGLARLRGLGRVIVVGEGADCPPGRADLQSLLASVRTPANPAGQLIAVWSPPGSWGASSVAVGLARSLGRKDPTLLLDANVHAPNVAELVNQPMGGLLQACLSADRGALELPVRKVTARLSALTGVEPAAYPAVHPGALHQVLSQARQEYVHVVIDTDSAVDPAGEIGLVPDWTTAAAVCLQTADHIMIVTGESDLAQERLWRSLPAVAELIRGRAIVVVNRCTDHRRTTARLARRLGDYLPEAAVGWIESRINDASLAPIVAEVAPVPAAATG
ncbi:MAG: hypothetical protein R2720_13210 [Candidatus Nanopelagicales bacterium]